MITAFTHPGLNKNIDEVIPGHDKHCQGGRQPKPNQGGNCLALFQELAFKFRVARLKKQWNELVEDGPDETDAKEAKSNQKGLCPREASRCHDDLLLMKNMIYSGIKVPGMHRDQLLIVPS